MAKFRARARTLDMLGRQQIAGIPTALHELFKNAYDAYADSVEVDFFRKSDVLMLRDDGIGMSQSDFEQRWLTLGTESKLDFEGNSKPEIPKGAGKRPVMGEKGIGRLAIATIGPIVLVLTRSRSPQEGAYPITVALIQWGVFELPSIDLSEIEIPIRTVDEASQLNPIMLKAMKKEILRSLDSFKGRVSNDSIEHLKEELSNWKVPIQSLANLQYGPNFKDNASGTHFIIHPVSEELIADIDIAATNGATSLERMLLGFSDTINHADQLPLKTHFRDHLTDGQTIDRIGEKEFFTLREFELADHKVKGHFDKYGNFKGEISVYGAEFKEFEIPLFTDKIVRACGEFDLSFAYVQGAKRDTRIPVELHEPLTAKLDKIGGLYIYKNGIRVLPYGNSDYDFLEIERRRTLSASHYFFSYRRMFGAIHIDAIDNNDLKEKAGREGFQSNKAYREFRSQLMSFFQELAARFFREDGAYAEDWALERDALQKEYKLAQKRQKSVTSARKKFKLELNSFFERVDQEEHVSDFREILLSSQNKISKLVKNEDLSAIAADIISVETSTNRLLRECIEKYKVIRPRAAGLTKALSREWERYQRVYDKEIRVLHDKSREEARTIVGNLAAEAKVHLDAKMRLEAAIIAADDYSRRSVMLQHKSTKDALSATEVYVKKELSGARVILQDTKDEIDKAIFEFDFNAASDEKFENLKTGLEDKLVSARKLLEDRLGVIRLQLERVRGDSDESYAYSDKAMAALETELEVLKEDYTQSLELAQLGMAVSIVQHEFESNVRGVRKSLRSMQKWAEKNEGLNVLYKDIRNGFDHLDNYLSMFTPLDRRLRRRKTHITGTQITEFLRDLFGERFNRHDVKFVITESGAAHGIDSYSSVILPVFVNLVDNSIHWLSKKEGERTITLDANEDNFILSDDGPGISAMDKDFIFEFGYSRKLGGQGMGLYIAKTSLNKEDLDINLNARHRSGASFIIGPRLV